MDVNIASYRIYDNSIVEESSKAPDYTASWMTGINVKIWNLENTIKNLTDQVKVLQKQNYAMKTDVKVASKTGIGFLWTITYGVYKIFPLEITTDRSSIMKLQKDSFQVRIMDLSESMSNYLRLSNNCCEKCLANTEISSRNCVQ